MIASPLKVAAISEIGLCKRENQDCVLARVGEGPLGDFGLFVVADGMGGQAGGRLAAEIAISVCETWWQNVMPRFITPNARHTLERSLASLGEATQHLNEAVIGLGERIGSKPGTTFSALFLYGSCYGFVHLGDTRIYHLNRGISQITQDDTWVGQQVLSGAMTLAQAENHPQKHVLIQCAGSGETVHVHQGAGVYSAGVGFLLCSDGFYHHLNSDELRGLPTAAPSLDQGLQQAVSTIYSRGATDNLSAILITT